MSSPTAPPDDADAGVEADLGSVSNEDWLRAHRQLIASGDIPEDELAYLYDPDVDPADVSPAELTTRRDPKEPDDV